MSHDAFAAAVLREDQLELFPAVPSHPPALLRARKAFEEAALAYEKASEWEDDTGEAIPDITRRLFRETRRRLEREEQSALQS